jgi:hypothetical protein
MDELNTKDVYVSFKDKEGNILKEGNIIVTNEFLERSNINNQVIISLEYLAEMETNNKKYYELLSENMVLKTQLDDYFSDWRLL